MTGYPRYAIYFAPEHGSALDRFGAHLLGYDAHDGAALPFPGDLGIADWRELTQDPRKYGFHATLKAPISLAAGLSERELLAGCTAFARVPRAIPAFRPVVDSIDGFLAIVPAEAPAELGRLAADCVRDFDPFRAPLTAEDRARRNPARLTPRQRDYLDRFGYPYAFEEFRFHMTLTGRLDATRRPPILDMLRGRFNELAIAQLAVDNIALFRQADAASQFRVIGQWTLARAARA